MLRIKGSYPKPITSLQGVNYQQLTEFEAAISTLEQDNDGLRMTSSGINLSSLQGTQVLWVCTECHCWRLIQPETAVSAQEANMVANGPVTEMAV